MMTALPSEDVIEFIERFLVVPEGVHVGEPIRLRGWQKDILRTVYDTPTRQAIVSMGGKTALIAMLVLAHLVGPQWRRNGQIYSSAQSREQAAIVFALAAKMARMSPVLCDPGIVVVRDSAKELFAPRTGMRYKALSAEASTAMGISPVLVVHDELGQVRGAQSALYDALESSFGAHATPLSIIISTQAPTASDLLSQLIDYAATGADPATKLVLYTAPEGLELGDEAGWAAANPALGDFLSREEVRGLCERARKISGFESAFRNLNLNQRCSADAQLFSLNIWAANGAPPDLSVFRRAPVFGGLDLSMCQDLTALVLVAEEAGECHVWPHFWTPSDTMLERGARDRQPYEIWARQGYLTAVPGVTIDYGFVAHRLGELSAQCDIREIRFDRFRIDQLKGALSAAGVSVPLEKHGQGYVDMAGALEALESVALRKKLRHGMNPVLNMCASNSIVTVDPAGNRKFDKAKASGRIDGMVALAMALNAATINARPNFNARAIIG
jgi:phage terminase large subunit-like protein